MAIRRYSSMAVAGFLMGCAFMHYEMVMIVLSRKRFFQTPPLLQNGDFVIKIYSTAGLRNFENKINLKNLFFPLFFRLKIKSRIPTRRDKPPKTPIHKNGHTP